MSKEDIEKAVHEAEQFAQEDKQRREEIDTRNNADQLVYQCEKMLSEEGDKFSDGDKSDINSKIDALKEALKGQDINLIKTKQEELQSKFYEISEKLYKAAQEAAGAQGAPGADAQGAQGAQGGQDENGYYDADYKDVTGE